MFLLIGCVLLIGIIAYVTHKVRKISRIAFGTEDILEGLKKQELLNEETPKSVSGMTKMELPRIEKDFPEFHWEQWKKKCENQLIAYLEAIEHQSTDYLLDASVPLKDQAKLKIQEARELDIQESFNNTLVHRTEIVRYERKMGTCVITVHSAVEYYHSLHGRSAKEDVENKKEQHRYTMELVYVQDITKLDGNQASFTMNCPNCGAPITNLGAKHCEFCGTAVEPVNVRVWELHKVEE